jgi:uncharacterized protein YacL (UPF0231 family)
MSQSENTADATVLVITEDTVLQGISNVQIQEKTLQSAKELLKFTIDGIDDREGYKSADTKRAKVRELRLKVQKRAKELKDQANEFKRRIDSEADRIVGILQGAEDHLKSEIARIDNVKEEAKRAEAKRRQELLIGAGFRWSGTFFVAGEVILSADKLLTFSDDELAQHIEAGKREVERIAQEQAELARLKAIEDDRNAKLQAEQETARALNAKQTVAEDAQIVEETPAPVVQTAPEPSEPQAPKPERSQDWIAGYAHSVTDLENLLADTSVKRTRAEIVQAMMTMGEEHARAF